MSHKNDIPFSELVGKTITEITGKIGDKEILFTTDDGKYKMYNDQDHLGDYRVVVEDITGDLDDLIGCPVLTASEDSNSDGEGKGDESFTWTFYNISTIKGHVTIRWYGSSNGYYSESVDFIKVK